MCKWVDYDAIDYRNDRLHDKSEEFLNGVIYMAQRIEDAPSIDIVRCKECKRFGDEGWCFWRDVRIEPDDYCSYGERIEYDE